MAKRTMFDTPEEIRFFLALLAREVHEGRLRVIAFCVMSTHFHLLVVSVCGELSASMQRIQNQYVRRFNRRRRRDGPLVRGRYFSRRVRTERYRRCVVGYIDRNPVTARLVRSAVDYPFGSAARYARDTGPRWLDRAWVEKTVTMTASAPAYDPSLYARTFGARKSQVSWIDLSSARASQRPARVDALMRRRGPRVLRWMRAKALLADGAVSHPPVVDAGSATRAIDRHRRRAASLVIRRGTNRLDATLLLSVALLRDLCCLSNATIAASVGRNKGRVPALYAAHASLLQSDAAYAKCVEAVTSEAIRTCHAAA